MFGVDTEQMVGFSLQTLDWCCTNDLSAPLCGETMALRHHANAWCWWWINLASLKAASSTEKHENHRKSINTYICHLSLSCLT